MSSEAVDFLRHEGKHEEARRLVVQLVADAPNDAELQYSAACVHDFLGYESEAVGFYIAAMAGDLGAESRRGAYLGLGSTYRTLGRYIEAKATLLNGLARFPHANELRVFLAMALHNLGQSKEAVESLLLLLAETSSDPDVQKYGAAIKFYAKDIEKSCA